MHPWCFMTKVRFQNTNHKMSALAQTYTHTHTNLHLRTATKKSLFFNVILSAKVLGPRQMI